MEAEEPPRCSRGGAYRVSLPERQRFVVTGLSLVINPASAAIALTPLVHVWAEAGAGHGARAIAIGKLSLENPIVPVQPAVELGDGDGEFVVHHDSAWSTVRLYGYCIDRSNPEGEGEPTTTRRTRFVEDIDADNEEDIMYDEEVPDEEDNDMSGEEVLEEEEEVRVEYEPLTEEDMAERYDSDNGEEDEYEDEEDRHPHKVGDAGEAVGESSSKARNSIALVDAPAGVVVPDGEFLGPAQFATVKNTAGCMRIAGGGTWSQENSNKEILVLYRYTRFSRTWSGRRGVEACRRTKLHWLRFAVPPAGDMGSALVWAGSSLGPLIYPGLFRRELGDLWSSLLVATPAINANTNAIVPPQATRLQVVVHAGILRREDYTTERMEHLRGTLEAAVGEAWPEHYHVGMELHLPEPVRWLEEGGGDENEDEDGGSRPAKRRRVGVAEGEECSLCLDPMESGLAAWPVCGHVFHGQCVEQTLAGRATCPLCRHHLFSDDALVC